LIGVVVLPHDELAAGWAELVWPNAELLSAMTEPKAAAPTAAVRNLDTCVPSVEACLPAQQNAALRAT
jgi:hypothetical protein